MKNIYMDNAATTQMRPEVLAEMLPFFTDVYGNASSVHEFGRDARKAVETARARVAAAIGAGTDEIIFTAGGTEADNTALRSAAEKLAEKGNHIITTAVEHHAVLHCCEKLEKQGFEVTYLPVDSEGFVTAEQVAAAITPKTILVSVMFANNEIGTIMPIAQIGAVCKERGVLFHTDAVQAVGNEKIDVHAMNIDMLSLSAHKFHGPKGVGALYVKKGVRLPPFMLGGAQEKKRRAGTENVPAIVGLGKAIELATQNLDAHSARLRNMRDRLIDGLLSSVSESILNGPREQRLAGNVNISFRYVEGESILLKLDINGIAGSSGSACTSGSLDPSHVLLAIGLEHEIAHGSLRLSLGEFNTDEDVDYVLATIPGIIAELRKMSPLYNKGEISNV